jgi:hypothetical protein
MMPGIGHNRGPAMDDGVAWRRHCWTVAREALLPHLPLEVVRLRVRRARELGLDYRVYATARETSGRDIIVFLFSSNALRVFRPGEPLPADRAAKLAAIRDCARTLLAHRPIDAARLAAEIAARDRLRFDGAAPAPRFAAPWAQVRAEVLAALAPSRIPPGAVMLVGDTAAEREWVEAARLGSYLAADRYFTAGCS